MSSRLKVKLGLAGFSFQISVVMWSARPGTGAATFSAQSKLGQAPVGDEAGTGAPTSASPSGSLTAGLLLKRIFGSARPGVPETLTRRNQQMNFLSFLIGD